MTAAFQPPMEGSALSASCQKGLLPYSPNLACCSGSWRFRAVKEGPPAQNRPSLPSLLILWLRVGVSALDGVYHARGVCVCVYRPYIPWREERTPPNTAPAPFPVLQVDLGLTLLWLVFWAPFPLLMSWSPMG